MSPQSGSILNLPAFAQQWRHALRLWRHATKASWGDIALSPKIERKIKERAEEEAKPDLERLLRDDKRMHSRLVQYHALGAFEPLPANAAEDLRARVTSEREGWTRQAVQGRYGKIADRQRKFFKARLLEAMAKGARVTARNALGVLEPLRRADVGDAQFDLDDLDHNCLCLRNQRYHGIEIELPVAGSTRPKPDTLARPRMTAPDRGEARFKKWADRLVDRGETITHEMAKARFPNLTVRQVRSLTRKFVPEGSRAKRGIAPSRRKK